MKFKKVFHIFLHMTFINVTSKYKKYFASDQAKKIYLGLALCLVIFFAFNDILMPWYANAGGIISVPSVVGLKYEDAMAKLDSLGFEPRKGDTRMDREHPAGIVIIQNPLTGAMVKKGRRVYLTISGGELLVDVPNIKGRTLRDARFMLEREGLKLGAIEYQSSDEFPENTVIDQRVNAGAKVKKYIYVSVVISQGSIAEKISVPDLTGKTLQEAEKILIGVGLKAGNITYVPTPDLLPNTIVDQYPRSGEMAGKGQAVDLIVVQGGEKKENLFEN